MDAFISDLFFNFVDHESTRVKRVINKRFVGDLAGSFAKALQDCGKEVRPEELREDFFQRL